MVLTADPTSHRVTFPCPLLATCPPSRLSRLDISSNTHHPLSLLFVPKKCYDPLNPPLFSTALRLPFTEFSSITAPPTPVSLPRGRKDPLSTHRSELPPPPPPPTPADDPKSHRRSTAPKAGEDSRSHPRSTGPRRERERKGESYEKEEAKVLRAALTHVARLGWSESAMISGARDVGVSPSIIGSFPRKEAALVEFFMDDCLQRLIDRIDSGQELQDLVLTDRLSKLIRIRLEMQAPYISKWPQALSIQAQPMNLPTSFRQRAELVDEISHAAGDHSSEIDWYVKRTVLGGIYSTAEVYMLTDHSTEFCDTWTFLERRIKDAFDLQKTVQEAAYLAEAVGAGMGNSVQGFMKRVFQS
ncbi:ubiquinone biosynthesis protein COQ9-B, mitochondrial [Asparagus officinalis]|uniref:ubiquinone biosynthesis protein COQ9-B, mitochondrial n=1 Tax=Asparagus officinalis TaxID=4686 RepID=UPI00098E634B|nr:ubiquinone biosynthesis protein COQ9-B, mitochondrial [Asparagus officinalis]